MILDKQGRLIFTVPKVFIGSGKFDNRFSIGKLKYFFNDSGESLREIFGQMALFDTCPNELDVVYFIKKFLQREHCAFHPYCHCPKPNKRSVSYRLHREMRTGYSSNILRQTRQFHQDADRQLLLILFD